MLLEPIAGRWNCPSDCFHKVENAMTVQNLNGIGFCARLDTVGDWAFHVALSLARQHGVVLNVFFFPEPCGEAHPPHGRRGELLDLNDKAKVELEKKVRLYSEDRLADFLEVGFRLCEGDEEPELRRCLIMRRDYDLLVLPYPSRAHRFGDRTIEEFAQTMPCPTILVGPTRENQLFVNSPARIWMESLGLQGADWQEISFPSSRHLSFAGSVGREGE
jgi:hypothetical protein